ncbi:MAG: precorrin-6y C5,15-methyltransferase (decarboxylating) subunit CbiE [Candidatus Bathyarchaeota archaeon]|nr:precorrin-6y C5,15-methyltransferase (decarboxylating) subunit CbiE [Candidatus Bathyarchaeota archaeon]
MAKLVIVGVGPGSQDYVTAAARKAVQQADVVLGSQRTVELMHGDIQGEAVVFTAKTLYDTLKQAAQALKEDKNVALLSVGDPGFSGLLHTAVESGLFQPSDICVVPGISSIQACAARLNLSWQDAAIFTFHEGKQTQKDKQQLAACLKEGKTAMVLPDMRGFSPSDIAEYLIKEGLDSKTHVFICENLTLPDEKVLSTRLGDLGDQRFWPLCIMVIQDQVNGSKMQ